MVFYSDSTTGLAAGRLADRRRDRQLAVRDPRRAWVEPGRAHRRSRRHRDQRGRGGGRAGGLLLRRELGVAAVGAADRRAAGSSRPSTGPAPRCTSTPGTTSDRSSARSSSTGRRRSTTTTRPQARCTMPGGTAAVGASSPSTARRRGSPGTPGPGGVRGQRDPARRAAAGLLRRHGRGVAAVRAGDRGRVAVRDARRTFVDAAWAHRRPRRVRRLGDPDEREPAGLLLRRHPQVAAARLVERVGVAVRDAGRHRFRNPGPRRATRSGRR